MKMAISSLVSVAGAVAFLAALTTTTGQEDNPLNKLSFAIHSFSTKLLTNLIESNPEANAVIAPSCIYVLLALVYAGAGGETRNQLAMLLRLDTFEDDTEFYDSIRVLLQTLSSTQKGFTWKAASRLYGQEGFEFKEEFKQKVDDYFPHQLESVDFNGDPSGAMSKINDWVSRMTSGKIQELFPQDTITSDTHLVLASAVYFSSPWLYRFDEGDTQTQKFQTATRKKVKVPMMKIQLNSGLNYVAKPDYEILELPSAGGRISTLIVLFSKNLTANSKQRRRALRIDVSKDESMTDIQSDVSVRLSLPKFSLSSTVNLKGPLQAIGLEDLFNADTADLSDIDPVHAVPLDEAFHKTYVAFNEDGKEAAWSTEGHIRRLLNNRKRDPIDFNVDRPFMFYVFEKMSGCILFKGYVANPLESN